MSLSWTQRIVIGAIGSVTLGIIFMAAAYGAFALYAEEYVQALAGFGIAAFGYRYAKDMISGKSL